jgi:hypothetical protein
VRETETWWSAFAGDLSVKSIFGVTLETGDGAGKGRRRRKYASSKNTGETQQRERAGPGEGESEGPSKRSQDIPPQDAHVQSDVRDRDIDARDGGRRTSGLHRRWWWSG